jgi:hypothetical protein
MNICKSISANTISVDLQSDFKLLNIESYLIEHPSVLSNGEDSAEIDENNELSDVKAGRLYVKYTCPEKETRDAIVQVKNGNLTENDVTELNTYISNSNVDKRMGILVGKSMDDKVAENLDKHDSIMIIILGKYLDENKNIFVSADTYTGDNSEMDFSQYRFHDEAFNKRRLVLAVIKDYVSSHPDVTFDSLKKIFELQGISVFATQAEAEKVFNDTHHKRNFIGKDEVIQLKDTTIAVSTQWTLPNIEKFINHCKTIGIMIDNDQD